MNTFMKGLLAVVVVSLPAVAFAQSGSASSSDAKYCAALIAKYEQYLDQSSKRGQQPQGLDTRAGIEKCKAGDPSGIPVIEKALKDAKYDLPPRT